MQCEQRDEIVNNSGEKLYLCLLQILPSKYCEKYGLLCFRYSIITMWMWVVMVTGFPLLLNNRVNGCLRCDWIVSFQANVILMGNRVERQWWGKRCLGGGRGRILNVGNYLQRNEGFALEVGIVLTPPFSLFISRQRWQKVTLWVMG